MDLSPAFDSDWLWYEADTASAGPAAVTATPTDGTATVVVKLDGDVQAGGLTFAEGLNTVTIEVTVGDETAIYTVWVTYTP